MKLVKFLLAFAILFTVTSFAPREASASQWYSLSFSTDGAYGWATNNSKSSAEIIALRKCQAASSEPGKCMYNSAGNSLGCYSGVICKKSSGEQLTMTRFGVTTDDAYESAISYASGQGYEMNECRQRVSWCPKGQAWHD